MQPQDAAYLDARFYYRDGSGIGQTSCHLARIVGAARVRALQTFSSFTEKSWLNRIAHAGENPAVLGFLVERAVLGIMVKTGTEHAGVEFSRGLVQQVFSGPFPDKPPTRPDFPVIYIPTAFNYHAVDAILATKVHKRRHPTKAIVVGIQVTIAGSHSASEEGFMKNWRQWHQVMGCDSTEFKFVWIVEHHVNGLTADWTDIPEKIVKVRAAEKVVYPSYQRKYVTIMNLDASLGEQLKKARNSKEV